MELHEIRTQVEADLNKEWQFLALHEPLKQQIIIWCMKAYNKGELDGIKQGTQAFNDSVNHVLSETQKYFQ